MWAAKLPRKGEVQEFDKVAWVMAGCYKKSLHIHSMQLYACTYLVGTKWKPTKTEPTLLQFG